MTNLFLISGANLDVITFQIINQLKIPATVFFSIVFLKSSFRLFQYLSVVILMTGVILVQSTDIEEVAPNEVYNEHFASKRLLLSDKTLGIVAGLSACVLSGFSGVYFEKILKSQESTVWSRNLQLSVLSIPPAFIASLTKDWWEIREKGFFHGYSYVVWIVIFLQASGGLIVALSVKLADNVSKSYATSCSIIVAGLWVKQKSARKVTLELHAQNDIGTPKKCFANPICASTDERTLCSRTVRRRFVKCSEQINFVPNRASNLHEPAYDSFDGSLIYRLRSARIEQFANRLQTVRSIVHTIEPNHSQTVCKPFGSLVCT
ncbi:hypothetical protein ACFE04_000007 [Oxalis oulophora]